MIVGCIPIRIADVFVGIGRDDCEVGLMQSIEHGREYLPRLFLASSGLNAGEQLIVYGLPVDASELRVPVLFAHGIPNVFERIEVEAALVG